jgi:hypothetical protein
LPEPSNLARGEKVPVSFAKEKRGKSFARLNLEDAGEVLPLSSLGIREFTGYNPGILSGLGQGMGRQVEAGDIGRHHGADADAREAEGPFPDPEQEE